MDGYCCIACGTTQSADFSDYQCPACGGNLEITYDYAAIAGDVEQGFHGDDIFRYAALLPVARPEPAFPLRIGATPLYKTPRLGAPLEVSEPALAHQIPERHIAHVGQRISELRAV